MTLRLLMAAGLHALLLASLLYTLNHTKGLNVHLKAAKGGGEGF